MQIVSIFLVVTMALTLKITQAERRPKVYTINLDLNREDIWTQVVSDHKQLVQDARKILVNQLPEFVIPVIEFVAKEFENILPQEYADEMNGIAKLLNVSVGDIIAMNLIYDVSAACTSIVSVDHSGKIWHARNLDYFFISILQNLTIGVQFTKGGQVIYSGVTYAGYIGLLTGQRPKAFTISINERFQGSSRIINFLIASLDQHFIPLSLLVRDTLEKDSTFDAAISRLGGTPIAAPVYFIVGGTKVDQAAVITKGRLRMVDFWQTSVNEGRWFLVETNYDHWTKPPATDDRRTPAIKSMNAMGQTNINVTSLYKVMSTQPVLNKHTTYTVVMSAAHPDVMTTWIRD